MWIESYEPGDLMVLRMSPGEGSESAGCATGCLIGTLLPAAAAGVALALHSKSFHDVIGPYLGTTVLFVVWTSGLLQSMKNLWKRRAGAALERVRIDADGICSLTGSGRALRSLPRHTFDSMQIGLEEHSVIPDFSGPVQIITQEPDENSESRPLSFKVDGVLGPGELQDFGHRVAGILGFRRFHVSSKEEIEHHPRADTALLTAVLEYRPDGDEEMPSLEVLRSYEEMQRLPAGATPELASADLDEFTLDRLSIDDDRANDRLVIGPRNRLHSGFGSIGLVLFALAVGLAAGLWRILPAGAVLSWQTAGALVLGTLAGLCIGMWMSAIVAPPVQITINGRSRAVRLRLGRRERTFEAGDLCAIAVIPGPHSCMGIQTRMGMLDSSQSFERGTALAVARRAANLLGIPVAVWRVPEQTSSGESVSN